MVGINKNTWINKFLHLDENNPIIKALAFLREGDITNTLSNDEVPAELKPLEIFTCNSWVKSISSVTVARGPMFLIGFVILRG